MANSARFRAATAVMLAAAFMVMLVMPHAFGSESGSETRGNGASADLSYSIEERRRICEEVWRKIALWYSYFDDKGIDWESVKPRYLDLAAGSRSDREFFACITSLLRELHDGHSYVYEYPKLVPGMGNRGTPRMRVTETAGRPIVAEVASSSDAEDKGVIPGLEIVSVDGQPAEERIRSLVPLITASTSWYARSAAVAAILNGDLDQAVHVELRRPDGTVFGVSLAREPFERRPEAITARVLDEGIGLLRLPSFSASNLRLKSGDALVRAFDDALEQLRATKAIIIDMRGNGGGDDSVAGRCAGRFFTSPVAFPSFQMRMVTLGVPWFAPRMGRSVSPRGPWQYTGPVVLLIDEFVFSSAEHFAAGMHDSGRATTVGHTTAGSSGNPVPLEVSGFRFQVSRWREYRADGSLIEGHGVPADIAVRPTVADLANGVDRVLAAAIDYLDHLASR
ncbi:MAG: S41 family peptidase [Bacillota bacterium]